MTVGHGASLFEGLLLPGRWAYGKDSTAPEGRQRVGPAGLKSGDGGLILVSDRRREGEYDHRTRPGRKDLVTDLLESELEDIRSELHHTQVHGYREALKDREKLVRGLLEKMKG
ncbi:MAG: hypothetical protein M0C28_03015 [Candidatus Moduliflexus flocculans]|nr:hypothetical protein [Candidatus Moduliflexus flocculans]